MSIPSEIIIQILYKQLIGSKLSADELCKLDEWIEENPKTRRHLLDELQDMDCLAQNYRIRQRLDPEKAYHDMCRRLGLEDTEKDVESALIKRKTKIGVFLRQAVAGIAILAIPILLYFVFFNTDKPMTAESNIDTRGPSVQRTMALEKLTPGNTLAVMTLPGGDTIRLSKPESTPNIATAGISGGKLQLEVPRGGEFAIVLEDSTKVWLNSESKLYYPTHFSSTERNVELIGEAYFEVTHQADRPFTVKTSGQKVTVYGTEFNIRSYPEEKSVYTTLSTGRIGLSRVGESGGEILLSPGKQAVFDKETSTARVRQVDIERVTGWRHGRFVFEEQSLRQIMTDLSRWYNFEFEFSDEAAAETIFMGSIPRYSNFKTAIAILEKSGGLVFSVKDNKVVIGKE